MPLRLLWSLVFFTCANLSAQVVTFNDSSYKGNLFPLMHKLVAKAKSQGAEFPKPFGITGSIYWQKMPMEIERVQIGNLLLEENGNIINVKDSKIENTTLTTQARADLWVLPFLNIYVMAGRVTTFNDINLRINLNVPPIPGLTPGDVKTIERGQIANVNGSVVAFGTVLAGGYKKIFANVNITWAQTHLNELKSEQKAFVAVPMVGYTTKFANLFVGAMYQNNGQQNKGNFTNSEGDLISYQIDYRSKKWNMVVGINKSFGPWQINIIQGFGARTNGIIEVGYRFGE